MSSLRRATLKQLRIFEAAARHLHFGRAAGELHLSQPAVSIALKQLETDAGLPLFEQMGRRVHLTRAGVELSGHARAMLARLQEADEAIDSLKGVAAGELHIASTTTAEYFVPRLLAEFRRHRPRVKIRLTVKNREFVVRDLAENLIDLVVMGAAPEGLALSHRGDLRQLRNLLLPDRLLGAGLPGPGEARLSQVSRLAGRGRL